jgi:hypothetical protein
VKQLTKVKRRLKMPRIKSMTDEQREKQYEQVKASIDKRKNGYPKGCYNPRKNQHGITAYYNSGGLPSRDVFTLPKSKTPDGRVRRGGIT